MSGGTVRVRIVKTFKLKLDRKRDEVNILWIRVLLFGFENPSGMPTE